MESTLSQKLTSTDLQTIEAELLRDLLSNPLQGWKELDAAILISKGRYFYQRRDGCHPETYTYKSLSPETISAAFNTQTSDSDWMLPGTVQVVRHGHNVTGSWAVLWIPPGKQALTLEDQTRLTTPLPGMVMIGVEQKYWITAISTKELERSARCYHAPLPNIYDAGQICWGNNQPPTATPQTIATAWDLFITSPFNTHLVMGKSRKHHGNVCTQLQSLHRRKTYPVNDLLPIGQITWTVEKWVNHIIGVDHD
jgi:hypothetical protein